MPHRPRLSRPPAFPGGPGRPPTLLPDTTRARSILSTDATVFPLVQGVPVVTQTLAPPASVTSLPAFQPLHCLWPYLAGWWLLDGGLAGMGPVLVCGLSPGVSPSLQPLALNTSTHG